MDRQIYEKIENLSPNAENYILTILSGEYAGEKALLSAGRYTFLEAGGFFEKYGAELPPLSQSMEFCLFGESVYAELLSRGKKLIVLGAGHVSLPILRLGKMIGMSVTCIDDRPSFAKRAESAGADRVICEDFSKALEEIPGDRDSYFVIVTRGHRYDQDCLRRITKKSYAYIGMMGSRRRVRIVKEQLLSEGTPKEILDGLHSPIGLDIHSETPEEIAISILAEIISVKNREKGSFGYPEEILDGISEAGEEPERRRVLATIIRRKGSAPRATGTKMLILPDGRGIGTIGGGCAEAEVIRQSRQLFADSAAKPFLCHVDLTEEAAAQEGMVCGGVLDVFLERV